MASIEAQALFTSFTIKNDLRVLTTHEVTELEFTSVSPAAAANLILRVPIGRFFLQATGSYQADIGGDIALKEDRDGVLLTTAGEPAKTDWTGGRLEIGIGFRLGKANE